MLYLDGEELIKVDPAVGVLSEGSLLFDLDTGVSHCDFLIRF